MKRKGLITLFLVLILLFIPISVSVDLSYWDGWKDDGGSQGDAFTWDTYGLYSTVTDPKTGIDCICFDWYDDGTDDDTKSNWDSCDCRTSSKKNDCMKYSPWVKDICNKGSCEITSSLTKEHYIDTHKWENSFSFSVDMRFYYDCDNSDGAKKTTNWGPTNLGENGKPYWVNNKKRFNCDSSGSIYYDTEAYTKNGVSIFKGWNAYVKDNQCPSYRVCDENSAHINHDSQEITTAFWPIPNPCSTADGSTINNKCSSNNECYSGNCDDDDDFILTCAGGDGSTQFNYLQVLTDNTCGGLGYIKDEINKNYVCTDKGAGYICDYGHESHKDYSPTDIYQVCKIKPYAACSSSSDCWHDTQEGYKCLGQDGNKICTKGDIGDTCYHDLQCTTQICINNKCGAAKLPLGSSCSSDNSCLSGICSQATWTCINKLPNNEECKRDIECQSQCGTYNGVCGGCDYPDGTGKDCDCNYNYQCPSYKPYCEDQLPAPFNKGYDGCISLTPEYCGDGECNNGETFNSCPNDCMVGSGTVKVIVKNSYGELLQNILIKLNGFNKGKTQKEGYFQFQTSYGNNKIVEAYCPDNTLCSSKNFNLKESQYSVYLNCYCKEDENVLDSDGDGWTDYEEVNILFTNPNDKYDNFCSTVLEYADKTLLINILTTENLNKLLDFFENKDTEYSQQSIYAMPSAFLGFVYGIANGLYVLLTEMKDLVSFMIFHPIKFFTSIQKLFQFFVNPLVAQCKVYKYIDNFEFSDVTGFGKGIKDMVKEIRMDGVHIYQTEFQGKYGYDEMDAESFVNMYFLGNLLGYVVGLIETGNAAEKGINVLKQGKKIKFGKPILNNVAKILSDLGWKSETIAIIEGSEPLSTFAKNLGKDKLNAFAATVEYSDDVTWIKNLLKNPTNAESFLDDIIKIGIEENKGILTKLFNSKLNKFLADPAVNKQGLIKLTKNIDDLDSFYNNIGEGFSNELKDKAIKEASNSILELDGIGAEIQAKTAVELTQGIGWIEKLRKSINVVIDVKGKNVADLLTARAFKDGKIVKKIEKLIEFGKKEANLIGKEIDFSKVKIKITDEFKVTNPSDYGGIYGQFVVEGNAPIIKMNYYNILNPRMKEFSVIHENAHAYYYLYSGKTIYQYADEIGVSAESVVQFTEVNELKIMYNRLKASPGYENLAEEFKQALKKHEFDGDIHLKYQKKSITTDVANEIARDWARAEVFGFDETAVLIGEGLKDNAALFDDLFGQITELKTAMVKNSGLMNEQEYINALEEVGGLFIK